MFQKLWPSFFIQETEFQRGSLAYASQSKMEFEKIPKLEYISVTGWGMGKIHRSAQLCSLGAFGQVTVSEDMMYLLFICSHHGME